MDYQKEVETFRKQSNKYSTYVLPDQTKIKVGEEMIKCPEIIFNPSLANKQFPGVHQVVFDCLSKCENEVRKEMIQNVILSGGNTMHENYVNRLVKELSHLVPTSAKVRVQGSTDRNFLNWMGGAVVSSLTTFQSMWITRADYDENGPSIVHRKCL